MKIKMTLLSDAIFGNGISVPGEEDISVQCDAHGFPFYRGSTFKGVFREKLIQLMDFEGYDARQKDQEVVRLLGQPGSNLALQGLIFTDFTLSGHVRHRVIEEMGDGNSEEILQVLTNTRTFTALDENGMVKEGTLRVARCVNKGLVFYSSIDGVQPDDLERVRTTLGMIKWLGTMRNRGFGKVRVEEV